MYSREQREAALEAYDRLGDVRAAVRELGYPSDTALAGWVRRRGEAPRPRKPAVRLDAHEKQGAVLRVLAGEEAARVAEDLGVTRPAVLNWRRAWSEEGAAAFMGDIAERTPGAAGRCRTTRRSSSAWCASSGWRTTSCARWSSS